MTTTYIKLTQLEWDIITIALQEQLKQHPSCPITEPIKNIIKQIQEQTWPKIK